MLAAKLFIGERLDFDHYKGIAITDYELEVLDQDGDPYSFDAFDSIHFELFAKPHGKSLSVSDLDVPADNIIKINVAEENVDLRPSYYYCECYGYTGSPALKVIFTYGVFEILRS